MFNFVFLRFKICGVGKGQFFHEKLSRYFLEFCSSVRANVHVCVFFKTFFLAVYLVISL